MDWSHAGKLFLAAIACNNVGFLHGSIVLPPDKPFEKIYNSE